MPAIAASAMISSLQWRYATKKFDPTRKVAPALWQQIEQAAVLAPSSTGLQPWKFLVITNPQLRAQLREASFGQPQVTDASHLVVFCARNPPSEFDVNAFIARVALVRQQPLEALDSYKNMIMSELTKRSDAEAFNWAARQTYLALGVLLSACAAAGVDACPMEGFDPERYIDILQLRQQKLRPVALAAVGYRAADDATAQRPKVRFEIDDVIQRYA